MFSSFGDGFYKPGKHFDAFRYPQIKGNVHILETVIIKYEKNIRFFSSSFTR